MSLTAAALLALTLSQARPAPTVPPRPTGSARVPDATPSGDPAAPAMVPPARPPAEPGLPEFGLALDAAFPQGVALGALYRPLPFLRLWAGPAWSYPAFGVQGGLGLVLVRWAVTPVVSVEAGRFFATDLSPFVKRAGSVPSEMLPLLTDVRYSYAAAHLGFEFGSQRGFTFALRLGLSRLSIRTSGTGTVKTNEGTPDETTLVFVNPRFGGTAPSLKLGLSYWF
jgi:hypothetical protein